MDTRMNNRTSMTLSVIILFFSLSPKNALGIKTETYNTFVFSFLVLQYFRKDAISVSSV